MCLVMLLGSEDASPKVPDGAAAFAFVCKELRAFDAMLEEAAHPRLVISPWRVCSRGAGMLGPRLRAASVEESWIRQRL